MHLIEVEERRLDLRAACTSMVDFCQRRLHMSEGAAFRRITAARLVKRFPALLGRIERGELHLSALVLLRPHLTEANVEELTAAAVGKTQREVEELLARRAPRPDVPSAIVALGASSNDSAPMLFGRVDASQAVSLPRARIAPLSEARYGVQLTATAELKAKLERARDLMRHRNPSGDLAAVVDAAMDLLLAKLEKERLGKAKAPREPNNAVQRAAESGTGRGRERAVPVGVRRAVLARDGEQCTFASEAGERCPQRGHLELDHVEARALGGTNAASNLRVRCRAHNRLAAEEAFGKAHVAERVDFRQRKSRAAAARRPVPSLPPLPSSLPSLPSPPSPPPPPPPAQVVELTLRGLRNMGFGASEARRAVDHVAQRHGAKGDELDVQALLRGAIAALT